LAAARTAKNIYAAYCDLITIGGIHFACPSPRTFKLAIKLSGGGSWGMAVSDCSLDGSPMMVKAMTGKRK